jgi:hypothetical protein
MTRETSVSERWKCGREMSYQFSLQLRLPFTCRKSATWSPPKACWGFFRPEKSDGFGRVWIRELLYQRPACQPLDHRSRLPSVLTQRTNWVKRPVHETDHSTASSTVSRMRGTTPTPLQHIYACHRDFNSPQVLSSFEITILPSNVELILLWTFY